MLSNIPLHSIVPRGAARQVRNGLPTVRVVSRKLTTFLEPERVFVHVFARERYAFWLDSSRVEPGLSRFSFMGSTRGPLHQVISYESRTKRLRIRHADGQTERTQSIFDYIDDQLHNMHQQSADLPFDWNGGFVGYFGYELKAECGSQAKHTSPYPDAMFLFADQLIAFDHEEKCVYLVSVVPYDQPEAAEDWFDQMQKQLRAMPPLPPMEIPVTERDQPLKVQLTQSYAEYLAKIETCQQYIRDGETYEVCLTNRLQVDEPFDPLQTYRILRQSNPAPYAAFLRLGEMSVLCSSPERFLKIDQNRLVETKPIKGTIVRGSGLDEDARLAERLRTSEKDRAENLMIVDLLRNDLGLVCEIGSVRVPKLMAIESYETVHQLVSTIQGRLRQELTAIDCIRSAFPGGSMTGAPKLRTMQFLDELETDARGIYSGAIGFLGLNGTTDLNIVIRTIVMLPTEASIGVGGAIVMQSDPDQEFAEILLKGRALVKALTVAHCGTFAPHLYTLDDDPTLVMEK